MDDNKQRLSSGVLNLDKIMKGGMIPGRSYLLSGPPGSGKTTIGLHFLNSGIENDEKALFISLSEAVSSIKNNYQSNSFALEEIEFLDLSPTSELITDSPGYNIFPTDEVEHGPLIDNIIETMEKVKPSRIFLDSITQLEFLAADKYQFRSEVLSFLRLASELGATTYLSSEASVNNPDDDLQFLCDGVVKLSFEHDLRYLKVSKFRGSDFISGNHQFKITDRGIQVFPRISFDEKRVEIRDNDFDMKTRRMLSSGVPEIDQLLHGGIEKGTGTIISGPSGAGKTTLGLQFLETAAGRGEQSIIYTFEEDRQTLIRRCQEINIPLKEMIENGFLAVKFIDPLKYTPDEFSYLVREDLREGEMGLIMIDSISGYRLAFNQYGNKQVIKHLHALRNYLGDYGVTVLLINEVSNITGDFKATDFGISYMADNIIFLNFLEMKGALHKTIGVLKKRMSDFEKHLREMEITKYGIKVGEPLKGLQGILTGNPEFISVENTDYKM